MNRIIVTKASGEQEPYDESKLRNSLARAGAEHKTADRITKAIRQVLYDGITTQEIYQKAFQKLQMRSQRSAGRYKLKNAIMELGPTGFPFEKFIGGLLNHLGYSTQVGVTVDGECVSHEIDVIAGKDDEYFMIECKFHNRKGIKCNVQVPLYIQSRFLDIEKKLEAQSDPDNLHPQAWLVTNTKFTSDALQYGECMGIKMLSWDYPQGNGLKELIDRVNLHPLTCLSSLSKKDKHRLTNLGAVFCKDLVENKSFLREAGINTSKIDSVLKEAAAICNHEN
ncbi:MAG TPA: ATP cone domain-containing protein [Balneolaceae bacterium]|nr:ATP cone domain-containing protein [Balneolaceae bacterium]